MTTVLNSWQRGLGALERLPFEIIQQVLSHLGMTYFRRFRSLNAVTQITADTMRARREILRHAPLAETDIFKGRVAEEVISYNDIYLQLRELCCGCSAGCVVETGLVFRDLRYTARHSHWGACYPSRQWSGDDLVRLAWSAVPNWHLHKLVAREEREQFNNGLDAMKTLMAA